MANTSLQIVEVPDFIEESSEYDIKPYQRLSMTRRSQAAQKQRATTTTTTE